MSHFTRVLLLSAGTVLFSAVQSADAALYAATAAGATGTLYTLDPANGAVLTTVGALNDVTGQNYPITGLAFHPTTGVLYGSTGNNPAATSALLVTINPATALVTVIGPFNTGRTNTSGTASTMGDLGFDAAGNLYGVGTIGGPDLFTINLLTGQATVVGANGVATSTTGGGVAVSAAGTIFGTPTASRFGTYAGTGAYTNIANPAKPSGGAYGALDFDVTTGLLYGLNVGSGSPPPSNLVTIDPATGAVTNLGASATSIDAIAFTVPEPASLGLLAFPALLSSRRRSR